MAPWRNWAGNISFTPLGGVREPTSEEEIVALVREAAQRRVPCRVVGHGHSWNESMCAPGGVAVSLRRYKRVLAVDGDTVTCQGGITLVQLLEHLADEGLTLPNVPVVIGVTVAGALCTAGHGSGKTSPSLSAQLVGCRLVDGRGAVVDVGPGSNEDLLPAVRASLGVLGIMSTITLRCVPAYDLHISEGPMRLSECMARIDELKDRFEFFKAWWVPHTGYVHAFCIDRKPVPSVAALAGDASVPEARGAYEDHVPSAEVAAFLNTRQGGVAQEHLMHVAAKVPAATPLVNQALRPHLYPTLAAKDASYIVQCNEHRGVSESVGVRFQVSEYAIPAAAITEAMHQITTLLRSRPGLYLSFPVDIRFSAADDIWLSPAYGRDTAWVGIPAKRPFGEETEHAEVFAAFEQIMLALDGRPHWAKEHSCDAHVLARRYEHWHDFMRVRERMDPEGVFLNDLARLVGRPGRAKL